MNMQVVLIATGTRGDVQPMIALGKGLKAAGHQVRVIAGSNFTSWVESHGLEMAPTLDMEAIMQSEAGIRWVESTNPLMQLRLMKEMIKGHEQQGVDDMIKGVAGADLIITGVVSEPYVHTLNEKWKLPAITAALQPYRGTRSKIASLNAVTKSDSAVNQWVGRMGEGVFGWVNAEPLKLMRKQLGLPAKQPKTKRLPALYAFSPKVVPPVEDTDSVTTGYWFLDEPFTPPANLAAFLEHGSAPVYLGFGSMPSSDPKAILNVFIEALGRTGQRGVLARGWGGAQIDALPENIFLLDSAPHDWLFPHMAAVVHHGGAGTTAAGLRAGKPALLIPHMADQPYWARRLFDLGVSAKPLGRNDLNVTTLTERLQRLLSDAGIQSRAARLGEEIRAEDGVGSAVHWIDGFMGKQ